MSNITTRCKTNKKEGAVRVPLLSRGPLFDPVCIQHNKILQMMLGKELNLAKRATSPAKIRLEF